MKTETGARQSVESFEFGKEIEIAAPIEIAFEAVLEQLGQEGQMPGGKPFPMTIETWPGGRWYRDLGNKSGHLWGHVQVIKPPKLLEIVGPMMMSYPVASHLQYRLTEEAGGVRLTLIHQAIGLVTPEHLEGVNKGWGENVAAIKAAAEAKRGKR